MSHRLLRTIVVTVTVTESWTLVWHAPEREESAAVDQRSRSVRSRSTSATLVAGKDLRQAGINDAEKPNPLLERE